MNKINSIKQLKAEKRRLKNQQLMLEAKMVENWGDIKESVRPFNLAKQTLQSVLESRAEISGNGEKVLSNVLKLGIGFLAKKLSEKGSDLLGELFKKKNK